MNESHIATTKVILSFSNLKEVSFINFYNRFAIHYSRINPEVTPKQVYPLPQNHRRCPVFTLWLKIEDKSLAVNRLLIGSLG